MVIPSKQDVIEALNLFINLDLKSVGSQSSEYCEPIREINSRAQNRNPHSAQPIPDEIVSSRISTDEARVMRYLQYASRWLPANPSKPDVVRRLAETYVTLPAGENQDPIANFQYSDHTFGLDRAIDRASIILISGSRGVGKTSFMNHWLNLRTRDLESKDTTWFRIDAAKVHSIWNESSGNGRTIPELYERYYVAHSLYVILSYSGFLARHDKLHFSTKMTSSLFKKVIDSLDRSHYQLLQSVGNHFVNAKKMSPTADDYSVDVVSRIVRDSNTTVWKDITKIKQEISNHFHRNAIKIISIIDGIDNIAWTKRNTFYQNSCNQFYEVIRRVRKSLDINGRFIFAARPETIFEIRHSSNHGQTSLAGFNFQKENREFEEWRIVPPPASMVVLKKIQAARNPDLFFDSHSRKPDERERVLIDSILKEIDLEVRQYPGALVEHLKEGLDDAMKGRASSRLAIIRSDLSEDNLLKFLYENDLRAYIDNVIKVFFIRRHLLKSRNLTHIEFQKRILQFVFLNGRPYFNSHEQLKAIAGGKKSRANFTDRGMVFPNVFWWSLDLSGSQPYLWQGLAGLRMLQLGGAKGRFCCADMLLAMARIFGYCVPVLIEILESFVAFGLIDIVEEVEHTFFGIEALSRDQLGRYSNVARLTEKGMILARFVLTRPDLLYFYALDTPLRSDFVVDDTRFVRSYRELKTGEFEQEFFSAAVPTVATFLMHILSQATQEDKQIRNYSARGKKISVAEFRRAADYFNGVESVIHAITLSRNLKSIFFSWAERSVVPTSTRTKENAESNALDIVGVLGGYAKLRTH